MKCDEDFDAQGVDEDGRYRVWVTVTMIVFVNPAADTEIESVGVRRGDLDVMS